MDDNEVAARQHLEELERDLAEQPPVPVPLWHSSVWILTWLTFTTSTVLLGGSDWIFLVYAATLAIFVALYYLQPPRAGGRLPRRRTPMTSHEKQAVVLVSLAGIGLFAISVKFATPWPLVAFNVAAAIAMLVEARRSAVLDGTPQR